MLPAIHKGEAVDAPSPLQQEHSESRHENCSQAVWSEETELLHIPEFPSIFLHFRAQKPLQSCAGGSW